jgi:hypothetical protein
MSEKPSASRFTTDVPSPDLQGATEGEVRPDQSVPVCPSRDQAFDSTTRIGCRARVQFGDPLPEPDPTAFWKNRFRRSQ